MKRQQSFDCCLWKILLTLAGGVVGSFLGDINIVGMALTQTCGGDTDKLALGAESVNIRCAAVAHTGADTAQHLEDGVRHGSAIRHTP